MDKANKKISIKRQCQLLGIHRSGYYYQSAEEKPLNLELMKQIDKQYTLYPFMGVPSMTQWLNKDMGYRINKKRVERLFRLMDIQGMVPGPHTSKCNKEHKKISILITKSEYYAL